MDQQSGTFVVTNADEAAAEFRDAESGQVFALSENPGVETGEVVEATLEEAGELGVAYRAVEVTDRRTVEVSRSRESPTRQAEAVAADQDPGDLTRVERAGEGELHVITVPAGEADDAAADVLADEDGLLARAARLGVGRVEVRLDESVERDEGPPVGVVSVRYLP